MRRAILKTQWSSKVLVLIGITKLTTAWIKTTHYVPIHPETVSRGLKKGCIQYIVACPWRGGRNRTHQTTVELSTSIVECPG